MYCGAHAVAAITGWTRDQAWLHVRALRERRGESLPRHPRGGIAMADTLHALNHAGYEAVEVFKNKRMRYRDFIAQYGPGGTWLLLQSRHVFTRKPHQPMRCPTAIIVGAWRVTKKRAVQ